MQDHPKGVLQHKSCTDAFVTSVMSNLNMSPGRPRFPDVSVQLIFWFSVFVSIDQDADVGGGKDPKPMDLSAIRIELGLNQQD